jgi:hypothetical protein
MLTRVHLENFKCFDALSLPLVPLTLLTGFNAAGKSTTLQSLLLLAQSLRSGNRTADLSLNGPLAQLGTPGEVLNERAESNQLVVGVETEYAKLVCTLRTEDRGSGIALRFSSLSVETVDGPVDYNLQDGLDGMLQLAEPYQAVRQLAEALREIIFLSAVRIGTAEVFPSLEEPSPIHANIGIQGEFAPWWFERFLDDEVDRARCGHDHRFGHYLMQRPSRGVSPLAVAAVSARA